MAESDDRGSEPFQVGAWRVEPSRLMIAHPSFGETRVSPRAMSVLLTLARARGEVVNKYALMDAVWRNAEVSEGVLSQTILELRNAFRDDARKPQMIETIRKIGFRLIPSVEAVIPSSELAADQNGSPGPRSWSSLPQAPVWSLAVAITIAAGVWYYLRATPEDATPVSSLPRIMVVPFEDLSPNGGYEYFAVGMADEIALHLAASSQLRLISNRAVTSLANQGLRPDEIANRFAVDLILTGSVQRRDREIKLVARLTEANLGEELWITSLNRPLGDVFAMQDETARSIASIVLRGTALPQRTSPTRNLSAYDLFLQGRAYQNRLTAKDTEEAIRLYEHALELDPNFTLARARLAESWAIKGFIFQEGTAALQRALLEAELALEAEPNIPEGLYAKALALMGLGRFAEARAQIQPAARAAPNHADTLFLSGGLADARGHLADAVRDYRLALQVNPTLPRTVALGRLQFLLGDPTGATRVAERGHVLAPGYPTLYLAHLMTLMGNFERAEALCRQALAMDLPRARNLCGFAALVAGRDSEAYLLLSEDWRQEQRAQWGPFTFAASGTHLALLADDEVQAEKYLGESEQVTLSAIADGNDYWSLRYNMAAIASLRREGEIAFEWLDQAITEGFRDVRLLEIDPAFEFVRDTQEFEDFITQINMELAKEASAL